MKYPEFTELLDLVAPMLGQHGAQVLEETRGLSEDQIRTLANAYVLVSGNRWNGNSDLRVNVRCRRKPGKLRFV